MHLKKEKKENNNNELRLIILCTCTGYWHSQDSVEMLRREKGGSNQSTPFWHLKNKYNSEEYYNIIFF